MPNFIARLAFAAAAAILGVASIFVSSPTSAASKPFTFSDDNETLIRRADEQADLPTLYRLLFTEIAREPDQAPQIVERLVELAPQRRDGVVRTASAAFPSTLWPLMRSEHTRLNNLPRRVSRFFRGT